MEDIASFDLFTGKNFIIYLIIINLIGFYIMWSDKRKAKKGKWRIPENTLFMITLLGGGIGTIAGMYAFRHKTQKLKFTFGLPAILILEIILFVYIKFVMWKNWWYFSHYFFELITLLRRNIKFWLKRLKY